MVLLRPASACFSREALAGVESLKHTPSDLLPVFVSRRASSRSARHRHARAGTGTRYSDQVVIIRGGAERRCALQSKKWIRLKTNLSYVHIFTGTAVHKACTTCSSDLAICQHPSAMEGNYALSNTIRDIHSMQVLAPLRNHGALRSTMGSRKEPSAAGLHCGPEPLSVYARSQWRQQTLMLTPMRASGGLSHDAKARSSSNHNTH